MTRHESRAPLRVLLVTDGGTVPSWLVTCLNELERSGAAHVVLAWRPPNREPGSWRSVRSLRHVLFLLHQILDQRCFRRDPDALAPTSLWSAFPGCRALDQQDSQPVNARWAGALREGRIDIVLDPFALLPQGYWDQVPRLGIWSTHVGQSGDPRTQSTPAFWEAVEGQPSTEARVCLRWKGSGQWVSLHVAVAPTDRRSVARSRNQVYWKLAAALARKIHMLWEDPDGFLAGVQTAAPFEVAKRPGGAPGNLQMLWAGTLLLRRYLSDEWQRAWYRERWELAYQFGVGYRADPGSFRKLIPPADRYWADPFPIQVGHEYYVFHEEFLYSTGKGSIVVTVLGENAAPAPAAPVLEKEYHLSYPFVFQWDGDWFMIPETAANHRVELYRCVQFPSHWTLERVLLSGVDAFDPTLAFLHGKWWLFANVAAHGAGANDELHLFQADAPVGPWRPHRHNPIKSDVRSARPAGRIFEHQGQFYRPAQDCSRRYGYAVSVNRIQQISPERYEEVEVDKLVPNWGDVAGLHTLNLTGNVMVIDYLVRRRRHGPRLPQ